MPALYLIDAPQIPKRESPERLPFWKGRRTKRICSFRGSYANRGNGMELRSSDVKRENEPKMQNRSPAQRVRFWEEETRSTDEKKADANENAFFEPCGVISDAAQRVGFVFYGANRCLHRFAKSPPGTSDLIRIPRLHDKRIPRPMAGGTLLWLSTPILIEKCTREK